MIESSITFLPVGDIEATTAFYTRVIGLPLWKDMGVCRIFSCTRGYWGFCQYGDDRPIPRGVCLSLNMVSTDEVDAQYARLVKAGAPLLSKPEKHPNFPVYSFFVKDPDGYTVEFQKILEGGNI